MNKISVNNKDKIRVSLYKVLLFKKVANSIKSGALNLLYSYKYKSFEDYLISKEDWESNKEKLLEQSGLSKFQEFTALKEDLNKALDCQYNKTNSNINNNKNPYVKIEQNQLKIRTPKVEKPEIEIVDLFPKDHFISLFEVVTSINKATNFLDSFEHWQVKYNREKPENKTFFAGIIGYGCNIGIKKIAKISKDINQNKLENTTNCLFNRQFK